MQEDFLHHVWKYQKFKSSDALKTNQGENLQILSTGRHNQHQSGPDFFNAQVKIGHKLGQAMWKFTSNHQIGMPINTKTIRLMTT